MKYLNYFEKREISEKEKAGVKTAQNLQKIINNFFNTTKISMNNGEEIFTKVEYQYSFFDYDFVPSIYIYFNDNQKDKYKVKIFIDELKRINSEKRHKTTHINSYSLTKEQLNELLISFKNNFNYKELKFKDLNKKDIYTYSNWSRGKDLRNYNIIIGKLYLDKNSARLEGFDKNGNANHKPSNLYPNGEYKVEYIYSHYGDNLKYLRKSTSEEIEIFNNAEEIRLKEVEFFQDIKNFNI